MVLLHLGQLARCRLQVLQIVLLVDGLCGNVG